MNARILVVDDNPDNIQVVSSCLSNKGFKIEFTLNGIEAVKWVEESDFDLLLLDVMMPGLNGFEVCEKIKKIPGKSDIPVIFLTAKTDSESISSGFEAGGVDYITKPFLENELLARVTTHIQLKQNKDKILKINEYLEQRVKERTEELYKSNIQLEKANNELENLDDIKREFLQIISHELRTPLNGILGGLSLLKESALPEKTMMYINLLQISVERLEQFSYKAIDVSYIRTIKKEMKNVQIDMINVINDCIIKLDDKIKEKNIKIEINYEVESANIESVNNIMNKCFLNLIENSIKFSFKNSTIKIGIKSETDFYNIIISDEGTGFPEKIVNSKVKMFNTSYQTEVSPGLGLYLADLIIRVHSGSFRFGNNSDRGAYVGIILPKVK